MFSLFVMSGVKRRSCDVSVVGVDGVTCLHSAATCLGLGGLKLYRLLCLSCIGGGRESDALSCLLSINETLA